MKAHLPAIKSEAEIHEYRIEDLSRI